MKKKFKIRRKNLKSMVNLNMTFNYTDLVLAFKVKPRSQIVTTTYAKTMKVK